MEFVADHSQMLADSEEGPTSSEQCLMSLRHGGASGPPCLVPIVEEEAWEGCLELEPPPQVPVQAQLF
jgi:hypothetical protein